jgi:cellulose synthase (UDP-forming)
MVGALRRAARSEFAGQNLVLAALLILGLLLCWVVVVTPLDLVSQGLFALLTITAMLLIKGHASRGVTLILVTLSIVISTRYILWMMTVMM